jgi:hypothetical protein
VTVRRDLVLSLSLANLCFLNVWATLNREPDSYFRHLHSRYTVALPALYCELALALLLFCGVRVFRRLRKPILVEGSKVGFLVVCLIPLNILRWQVLRWSPDRIGEVLGRPGFLLAGTLIAGSLLWIGFVKPHIPVRMATVALLGLAPLVPINIATSFWFDSQLPPASAFVDKPLAPRLPTMPGAPRFLWIIFDELDQYLAFENRPKSVLLPEFDRLRAQSIFGTRASSPAGYTLLSMPELISGRFFAGADATGPDQLMLTSESGTEKLDWGRQKSVFSEARQAGFNTALIGWQHPYGRILNESLTDCAWQPGTVDNVEQYAEFPGIIDSMRNRTRSQLQTVPFLQASGILGPETEERERRIAKFTALKQQAVRLAADRNVGLVLLHLPVPHPPGIYDRTRGKLSADDSNDYLDNLVLADRTLGEIRSAMEANGTWDGTTILVSADHPLRVTMWDEQSVWDNDEDAATGGKEHPYVPFLLKMPGSVKELEYTREFNSVLSHNLILAVLRNRLSAPLDVREWLDRQPSLPVKQPAGHHH